MATVERTIARALQAPTLGTLAVIIVLAFAGYWAAARVRRQEVEAPLESAAATVPV